VTNGSPCVGETIQFLWLDVCLYPFFVYFVWYRWVGSCIIPWPLPCLSPYCFFCHFNIVLYHHCPQLFKHQIIETFTMMMIVKLTNDVNSLQFWNIKLTRDRCGNHDGLLFEALLWTWTMNFKCAIQTLFVYHSLCLRYTELSKSLLAPDDYNTESCK